MERWGSEDWVVWVSNTLTTDSERRWKLGEAFVGGGGVVQRWMECWWWWLMMVARRKGVRTLFEIAPRCVYDLLQCLSIIIFVVCVYLFLILFNVRVIIFSVCVRMYSFSFFMSLFILGLYLNFSDLFCRWSPETNIRIIAISTRNIIMKSGFQMSFGVAFESQGLCVHVCCGLVSPLSTHTHIHTQSVLGRQVCVCVCVQI